MKRRDTRPSIRSRICENNRLEKEKRRLERIEADGGREEDGGETAQSWGGEKLTIDRREKSRESPPSLLEPREIARSRRKNSRRA